MIELEVRQNWFETSSATSLEEFKSGLAEILNTLPADRHSENRWVVTKVSEGDSAALIYDERTVLALRNVAGGLQLDSGGEDVPRHDDVMYGIRYAAARLDMAVVTRAHGGARLPRDPGLAFDHSFFRRARSLADFFSASDFIPRFAPEGMEDIGDGIQALVIYLPYFWEVEFDRDREGLMTLRLKMHVFVHGLTEKTRSDTHDWV